MIREFSEFFDKKLDLDQASRLFLHYMQTVTIICAALLTAVCISGFPASAREIEAVPPLLSRTEADLMIADEMAQRHQAEMDRRHSILGEDARKTWAFGAPKQGVVLRSVAPRPWTHKKPIRRAVGNDDLAHFDYEVPETRTIHLSITVFDHQASELVWRDGQESHTAISNIDFNHLSPIGGFKQDGISWRFFCFVENIDSEKSREFESRAREAGHDAMARIAPDISMLDADQPDYAVYADDADQIPDAMIEALNALHAHYAIHGPRLEAQWKRAQTLNAARRAWHEANPPVPRDTITNFWPVRSKRHATQP